MYKITLTADGTAATATKVCRTKKEAEQVREQLLKHLKAPVSIEITLIGKTR